MRVSLERSQRIFGGTPLELIIQSKVELLDGVQNVVPGLSVRFPVMSGIIGMNPHFLQSPEDDLAAKTTRGPRTNFSRTQQSVETKSSSIPDDRKRRIRLCRVEFRAVSVVYLFKYCI